MIVPDMRPIMSVMYTLCGKDLYVLCSLINVQ
jgi:hypothetical protein